MTSADATEYRERIRRAIPDERENFAKWLSEHQSSIESIGEDIESKGGSMEGILEALAMMEVDIEVASEYARKGDEEGAVHVMVQARLAKDAIYGELMRTMFDIPTREIPSKVGGKPLIVLEYDMGQALRGRGLAGFMQGGVRGNMSLWRDYMVQKYDGGLKQVEFILANRGAQEAQLNEARRDN